MTNYDLTSATLRELKSLQKQVEREIANRDKRLRKEALNALKEKAKKMGYPLDELLADFPGAKGKTRAPAPPKYRSLDDPDRTWSGRGRPPLWIKEAQEKGIDIETMRIKDEPAADSTN